MAFTKVRSASEVKDVINGVIDLTLGIATQGYFDPRTSSEQVESACLVNADFHDLAARHGGIAALDEAEETRLRDDGRDSARIDHLRRLVRSAGGGLVTSDVNLRSRLDHIGVCKLMRPPPKIGCWCMGPSAKGSGGRPSTMIPCGGAR